MDKKGLINSQEEYDRELEKFNAEIKEMSRVRNIKLVTNHKKFLDMLDNAERIGLFSKEDIDKWRKTLYDGARNSDIKGFIKRKLGL